MALVTDVPTPICLGDKLATRPNFPRALWGLRESPGPEGLWRHESAYPEWRLNRWENVRKLAQESVGSRLRVVRSRPLRKAPSALRGSAVVHGQMLL